MENNQLLANTEDTLNTTSTEALKWNRQECAKFVHALLGEDQMFLIRNLPIGEDTKKTTFYIAVQNRPEDVENAFDALQKQGLDTKMLYIPLQAVKKDSQYVQQPGKVHPCYGFVNAEDIDHYQYLYIDCDPEHPANTQATEEQVGHARELAENVQQYLEEAGFPKPICCFTGNGFALYYRLNLPNVPEIATLINNVLKCLDRKFSNAHAKIDTTVSNPPRVTKLCGCVSCKGEHTPETPYRVSKIISLPEKQENVTKEQLQKITGELKKSKSEEMSEIQRILNSSDSKKQKNGCRKTAKIADVRAWLHEHKLNYRIKEVTENGEIAYRYELENCPCNVHDNSYCSAILVFADGNAAFNCFHDHCKDYTIQDMLEKYPLVGQLPLCNSNDDGAAVYNAVVTNCKLVISDDNNRYVVKKGKPLIDFDSEKMKHLIIQEARKIGIFCSTGMVQSVHMNISSLYNEKTERAIVADRIAYKDGIIYYALDRDKVVSISAEKVELLDHPGEGVYFYYHDNFCVQCDPDLSVPATELPKLVKETFNINDEYLPAFLAQLTTFYFPQVHTPILLLSGAPGVSKSTTCRKLKNLISPSLVDTQSMPDKVDSLYATLSHNYLVAFDNAAKITEEFSNALCISCTGGYISKRTLYTTNNETSINLHCKLIINGVDDIMSKPDLIDRTNRIYLDKIAKRLSDEQVKEEFDAIKPKLLGAIFNCLKDGMKLVPETKHCYSTLLPRMVEFGQYGAAMIQAMGLDPEKFLSEYKTRNDEQKGEQIELDDFTILIKTFLANNDDKWEGESGKLLEELGAVADRCHLHMDRYTASTLSKKLNNFKEILQLANVEIEHRKGRKRMLYLKQEPGYVSPLCKAVHPEKIQLIMNKAKQEKQALKSH